MAAEGIFEEMDAAPGQLELKVRDSHGERMALLQFRAGSLDDELIADLKRWHARKNPTHLTLGVPSDRPPRLCAPVSAKPGIDAAPPSTPPVLRLG